jgi:hypothetical protein
MCRTCGVDKCSPLTPQYAEPRMSRNPPTPQNTKMSCEIFRAGFHLQTERCHLVPFWDVSE